MPNKAKSQSRLNIDDLYYPISVLDALYRPIAKEARRVLADNASALNLLQLSTGVPPKSARPLPKRERKVKATPAS